MNKLKIISSVCIVLFLSACAKDRVVTLQSLNDRELVVEEKKLDKISRDEVMQSYHKYLDEAPANHPMYKNALNRLADMEMMAGDEKLFQLKEEKYQEAFEVASTSHDLQGSNNYANAINLYEDLLSANPNDKRNDWVLYQLARGYEQLGKIEKALEVLTQLVKKYPRSEYFVESQFRRGEINFILGEFEAATNAFSLVLRKGKNTEYYERALYKYGWSLFKQDRYERALDAFFAILQQMPVVYDLQEKIDTRALSKVEKEMLDDIFRAINLCISYAGGVNYASKYFDKYAQLPFEYEVFNRLGIYFVEHERVKDAADAFGVFVHRQPYHPMSASLQIQRIEVYDKGRFGRSALEAREEFIQNFGVGTEFWYRQNSSTKAILRMQVKTILNELSEFYHARLQKNRKNENFVQATHWYQQYIKMFPGDEDAARKQFLLGELYSEKKLFANAAVAYEKAAYGYDVHKYSHESAYAAIDAYNKALKEVSKNERPEWQGKLLDASIKYLQAYPSDKRALAVRVKVAEDLFALKRFDEAEANARLVLSSNKSSNKFKMAMHIIIGHIAFEREDYLLAQSSYQKSIDFGIKNKKLKREVDKRLAASTYRQAEAMKASGNLIAAAEGFLAVSAVSPRSGIGAQAEYDAATTYVNLKEWKKAIQVLESFRAKYPRHKLQSGVPVKLAVAYEEVGLFSKAARETLSIGEASNDQQLKREAFWSAANLYEKGDNKKLAIASYKKYVRAFPKPVEQALEGKQKLIDLYYSRGQLKKRKYWLKNVVSTYDRYKGELSERSLFIIANASVILADEMMASYQKTKLKLPLKKSLRKKKRLMKQTLRAYEKVADVGVAEFTTASTYKVAQIYQELGQSIMSSQRPRRLSAEEREEYDLLLEEQAFPFEEKAISIYETNLHRISQGVYDQWIQQSISKLGELQPARYKKEEVHNEMYTALD